MNQFAIALFEDALILPRFDQRIDGLGGMLRLLIVILRTGERDHRLQKAEEECEREDQTDQQTQQKGEANQPASAGARKKQIGQKAVESRMTTSAKNTACAASSALQPGCEKTE